MHDLHIHLGGAVPSSVLWEILCDNGLQTQYEDFDSFHASLTANAAEVRSLDDFLGRYFKLTEEIQSSPSAASVSAYQVVAKAYRRAKIRSLELRFNPLKRVRHGLHTADAIILAVMQGLERASLHYPVRTGIILSLGRDLPLSHNWQIIEAAIKWRSRGALNGASGVVAIDMAGPESGNPEGDPDWLAETSRMMLRARSAGLRITYHIGESAASGPEGMLKVIRAIAPDRIGHGIALRLAQGDIRSELLTTLRERRICLELCPTVNIVTRTLESYEAMASLMRLLSSEKIPFCINTDNPYLIHTHLAQEYALVERHLPDAQHLIQEAHQNAVKHSFLLG
jgi:adenosine deaminase